MDKLLISMQPIANQPWFPVAMTLVGLLFAWSIFKTLKTLPKLVMYPIIFATGVILFMSWVYHRNEPEFLTPFIDVLEPWFPTKGA